MEFSDALQKRIAEALINGQVSTRDDLLENFPMEITVTPTNQGYCNPRVTSVIDGMSSSEVTHVKCTPMVADGIVVVQPASKGETGAIELVRGDTRRTGTFTVRAALNGFALEWPEDRKLKLPVFTKEIPLGKEQRTVLIIQVKRPVTKKRTVRTKKSPPAPPSSPTGTEAPGAQPKETKPEQE